MKLSGALRPLPAATGDGAVFYLHGTDAFRREEAVRALIDAHLDPATRDFNLDQLRGADTTVEHLSALLSTPPMLAQRRVVVVRELEAIAGTPRFRDLLLRVVEAPPPAVVLILSCQPTQAGIYRTLASRARSAPFPALSMNDLPGWLMERARDAHGRELTPEAATALAAALGDEKAPDLGLFDRELGKLADVAAEGAPIDRETVDRGGVAVPRQNRWAWFDLIGERRFPDALKALPVLEGAGEHPVALVMGIATQLLRIGVALDEGAAGLERRLPANQRWLAKKVRGQTRGWSAEGLEQAVAELCEADLRLKSGAGGFAPLEDWLLARSSERTGTGRTG